MQQKEEYHHVDDDTRETSFGDVRDSDKQEEDKGDQQANHPRDTETETNNSKRDDTADEYKDTKNR